MIIEEHELRAAFYAAEKILNDEQMKEFIYYYNEEYKRIYDEVVAADARKMEEQGIYG